ncbi:MAG: helix-turn-helix transcriptional regulator [Clostridia bacterium]|nr:helix-turn-helix transcriptional regulator [Clostridia bacterium]
MSQCIDSKYNCPVEVTLELIGGKWKALILWHLSHKTLRFGELRKLVPKATQKMLTQQLRDLENDGLIVRKVYTEVPPKVEYSLSGFGESIKPVLDAMCTWGSLYLDIKSESIFSRD